MTMCGCAHVACRLWGAAPRGAMRCLSNFAALDFSSSRDTTQFEIWTHTRSYSTCGALDPSGSLRARYRTPRAMVRARARAIWWCLARSLCFSSFRIATL